MLDMVCCAGENQIIKKYVNDINIQTNSVLGCIQYKKHVDSGKKLKIEIN